MVACSKVFLQVFCDEIKDIKRDLDGLNAKINDANKTMSELVGERARLQARVDFLSKLYANDVCPNCLIS